MLKLCGFAASNYYNKVKLALLEKGLPFEEELAWVGEVDLGASPLGKVPYLKTEHGALSESAVICEYIEQTHPAHPLLPSDPFAAAKVRELITYLQLHLELVARNLYPQAFLGGQLTAGILEKNIAAFAKLARFDQPFIAGDQFSLADCTAIVHLPLISGATKIVYGRDYLKRMGERPHVQKINADRKTNTELMLSRRK